MQIDWNILAVETLCSEKLKPFIPIMKEDWRAVAEANGIKINLHKNHDVRSKIFFTKKHYSYIKFDDNFHILKCKR